MALLPLALSTITHYCRLQQTKINALDRGGHQWRKVRVIYRKNALSVIIYKFRKILRSNKDHFLTAVLFRIFARWPLLSWKNIYGSSHPCSRKYSVSRWYVSKIVPNQWEPLEGINRLVFVIEMQHVYWEVWTEFYFLLDSCKLCNIALKVVHVFRFLLQILRWTRKSNNVRCVSEVLFATILIWGNEISARFNK